MARKHQSVRFGLEEHQALAAEMGRANINESEAIRRLVRRGAGLPEPVYILAQLDNGQALSSYRDESEKWRHTFAGIRGILRAPLPALADAELRHQVETWRAIAKKLEKQCLDLGALAGSLAQKMMGIGPEEMAELQHAKRYLISALGNLKKRVDAGDPNPEAPEYIDAISRTLCVIKSLGV